MAPEILLQNAYDKSVDLWSLGVLLHLMLSGTLPFDSDDDREIARKTIYQEIQFQNPVWNEISAKAKELIMGKYFLTVLGLLQKEIINRATLTQVLEH